MGSLLPCLTMVRRRDWLVCLSQEWTIIWKAKWSLVKVLYLIARYWSLGAMSFALWAFTANIDYSVCKSVVHVIVSPRLLNVGPFSADHVSTC